MPDSHGILHSVGVPRPIRTRWPLISRCGSEDVWARSHRTIYFFCGAGGRSRADRLRQRRASTLSADVTGEPAMVD